MSSSPPPNPVRRKSGSVGRSSSPERRRSNRLSSIVSARSEPEAEVEDAQVADDASAAGDDSASKLPNDDDAPPSDDPDGNASGVKRPPTPLATKFNPWNFGEIPHTVTRVYLTNDEQEDDENEVKESDDDGGNLHDEKGDKKGEKESGDDENDRADGAEGEKKSQHSDEQGRGYTNEIHPLPDFSNQLPARSSNAQAVPSIQEDRGIKFKAGSRYVDKPGEDRIDQEDHMFLKLVDMRPKSKTDRNPKRQLILWHYANGAPKDWTDKYAIKKLNAAHQDNIRTICHEFTWSQSEAEFIAKRFRDEPEMSIRELAYRFNNHFMDDHHFATPKEWDAKHTGRTIESIRGEYLFHKELYDSGKIPQKSEVRGKNFRHANGMTEEQMKKSWKSAQGVQVPEEATQPKTGKAPGKTSKTSSADAGKNADNLPQIRNKGDYKSCTIPDLKKLAKSVKPDGFLKGLKKKAEIVKKLEDDWSNSQTGGSDNESDEDVDADKEEEDVADNADDGNVIVPLYHKGDKKGLPNYNGLTTAQLKELSQNRGVQLPGLIGTRGSVKARGADYQEALKKDDEEKGRYKKAKESHASKSAPSKKRKLASSTEQKSNKKQKKQESQDEEDATDNDDDDAAAAPVVSPSSSKRKPSKASEAPISSRKASLRSNSSRSNSSRSNSTAVAAKRPTAVTDEEVQQVNGVTGDSPSDVDNEGSNDTEMSEEE